jgi:hypothetical protein
MHGSECDAECTRSASHATGDFERARGLKLTLAALPAEEEIARMLRARKTGA